MTLDGFRTEIAARLSLNVDDSDELALIDQWINEGVEYVVGEGQTKVASATSTLEAGVGDYDLDTDILRVLWISSSSTDDSNAECDPVGPTEILRRRLNSDSQSSPAFLYAIDGANLLMLYPTPAGADTLTIYYVPRPATLAETTDTPGEIPSEFHRLVVKYALWAAADYDDDQTSAQGTRYKQELDAGVREMKKRINQKRGRHLPRAIVARRRRVPHRNDVDLY